MVKSIAITPGEPAGIGPDLCIALAQNPPADTQLVVVADRKLLQERAEILGSPLKLKSFDDEASASLAGELSIVQVDPAETTSPGTTNPANAGYVLETLRRATDLALQGKVDAVVTGPVNKAMINEGGFPFSGHTEFLAEHCNTALTVMMLATEGLRVALATTHLPLTEVPAAITKDSLEQVIRILHADLHNKFGIASPRILVCGLNPHAGEEGHLGHEEIDVINPVLEKLRQDNMDLSGPLPADTLFTDKYLNNCDAVLAMYHDQGLPVLKYKGFGNASNITLGLPIIRTSVDHGTALDLVGTGNADAGSLYNAIETAISMSQHFSRASGDAS